MNYYLYINYIVYPTNYYSGNSHGGTAIIIKENIKHYLLEKIQDKWTETTVSATCCPPRHIISSDDYIFIDIFYHA